MSKSFIFLACLISVCASGAVSDPVVDFLHRSDKAVYRPSLPNYYLDDRLYRFDVDLNRDGKKEVLLSSTLERDGKQGNVFFVYSELGAAGFEPVGEMHLSPAGFYLGPIDEVSGYGIVKFWPAGGGTGGYSAYLFDGSRIIETPLGAIERNPQTLQLEGKGIEIAAKYAISVPDSIRDQVDRLRNEQGYAAPNSSTLVAEAQTISSEELAQKYKIAVLPKTYQEALQEESLSQAPPRKANAFPTPSAPITTPTVVATAEKPTRAPSAAPTGSSNKSEKRTSRAGLWVALFTAAGAIVGVLFVYKWRGKTRGRV